VPKVSWVVLYGFVAILHAFQQRENFENQLRFDKVTESYCCCSCIGSIFALF